MDQIGEFIVSLQSLLDNPNTPQDALVNAIQPANRDFLANALAVATLSWPTRTHLELVKIALNIPQPEAPLAQILADPTTNHEPQPFFGNIYFEQLRERLLRMPIETLAMSDGAWLKNIGFSIEAAILQVVQRVETLEKIDQQSRVDEAHLGQDLSRLRIYCAHVLGHGIIDGVHWRAIAQMVFAMFHVLPWSTRVMDNRGGQTDLVVARLVVLYESWLQIIKQIFENHGPALCHRMPTVIEDPVSRQFTWGIPTLHSVAATEVLRNFVVRRTLLRTPTVYVPGSAMGEQELQGIEWVATLERVQELEQRLEQLEQAIMGQIITQDATAVYGMMTEMHHLLQILGTINGHDSELVVPGSEQCVAASLARACTGLAPILGFDVSVLSSAMDMSKLVACLNSMNATAMSGCYMALLGQYPSTTGAHAMYAESLSVRIATTVLNLDVSWADLGLNLSPALIDGISAGLASRIAHSLRVMAAMFDTFSLITSVAVGSGELATTLGLLMEYPFMARTYSESLANVVSGASAGSGESKFGVWLVGLCEMARFAENMFDQAWLYHKLQTTVESAVLFCISAAGSSSMAPIVSILADLSASQWQALDTTTLNGNSILSILFALPQRLAEHPQLQIDSTWIVQWNVTLALCRPTSARLAYALAVQLLGVAQKSTKLDSHGSVDVVLRQTGMEALKATSSWFSNGDMCMWGDRLLFMPAIARDKHSGLAFVQSQLKGAMDALQSNTDMELAHMSGVSAKPLTTQDMRRVAGFFRGYIDNASDLVPEFVALFSQSPGPQQQQQQQQQQSQKPRGRQVEKNPFETPNILAAVPTGSAPAPELCNVVESAKIWRRNASRLSFAESRKHIQSLISGCYPSPHKHYLDFVMVEFMSTDPIVGPELVIGSIADHMFVNSIVYGRQESPFSTIRGMFVAIDHEEEEEQPVAAVKGEPVFNAVVGGRVRKAVEAQAAVVRSKRNETTVRAPVACMRVLLILTALRYGQSFTETPIYSWLTDVLDNSPESLQKTYFAALFGTKPNISQDFPTEPDWPRKARALVDLWTHDARLEDKPIKNTVGYMVLMSAIKNGTWKTFATDWAPATCNLIRNQFAMRRTSRRQAEIIRAVLQYPVNAGAPGNHPIWVLAELSVNNPDRLTFANARDWFIVHALPAILGEWSANENARALLCQLMSSVDLLYKTVPWIDVATSLVQNIFMSNGPAVAFSSRLAKDKFVAYLSPLARVLLSIADYIAGKTTSTIENTAEPDASEGDDADEDDSENGERAFSWTELQQSLSTYLKKGGKKVLEDSLDALLDVYTHTGSTELQKTVEKVLVSVCSENTYTMNTTLRRVFSKRPLDISTLHNLRPKEPAEDPKPAPSDPEPEFKPANEIFPLAKLLLDMAVRADALNAAKLVENTLWDVAEEPDVRRNLIALKPRLIPKDQRPLSTSNTSHEAVSAITSGSLHISAEARASAAAYALERNVSILNTLLPLVSMEDPNWHKTIVYWVHSRLFLAGVMTAICDSMRQFSTLGVVRELFAALWHAAKDGELAVDGIAVKRTWSAVNFCPLAMRLSNQVNEEYMTWEMVQEIASRT